MTKKDYVKLAQALKDSKPDFYQESHNKQLRMEQWNCSVIMLANTLQLDNPQFNRARFLHACGYTQEG